jgi:putative tricarboxylic transport membrane protein
MTETFFHAFLAILTIENILAMVSGTLIGILIGALPGISTTIGLAVLIPLTFGIDPLIALGMMAGMYNGSIYGGAIPAVLINIPGTPSSIATTFDGYPLSRKGKSALALRIACYSSALGGVASALALMLFAPPLARLTVAFGPAEYFWVAVLGLSSVSLLLGADPVKGLIAACVGLLISTVGIDLLTGNMRFTFGRLELADGVNIIIVLIGLFALPRVLLMAEQAVRTGVSGKDLRLRGGQLPWALVRSLIPNWTRSSLIGIIVGILPGAGGNMAAFLAYNEAKRASKDKDAFGQGSIEGLAAAETGNSADNASSMIPALSLGVPGNSIAALILGGLLVHGLQPGPALFRENPDIVYGFMIQMLLTSLLVLPLGGLIATTVFSQALRMPPVFLAPIIVGLMCLGVFTVSNSPFDLAVMLCFGILGYAMDRLHFPMPPLVLGVILGGLAESSLRTALRISRGDTTILFTNTISQILIAMILLTILAPAVRWLVDRRRDQRRAAEGAP